MSASLPALTITQHGFLNSEAAVADGTSWNEILLLGETVFTAADVFVQPSLSEGLPLAVLEAMASGLPIVATRVGGIPEAVVDGETGFLVAPGEPAALATALARVLEADDQGASLGIAARERAAAHFSVDSMADHYRRLYHELRCR